MTQRAPSCFQTLVLYRAEDSDGIRNSTYPPMFSFSSDKIDVFANVQPSLQNAGTICLKMLPPWCSTADVFFLIMNT